MQRSNQTGTSCITRWLVKASAAMVVAFMVLVIPATVYADNTARHTHHFSNPNWPNMHHYSHWNWQHNWAYQAPRYQFENTFPYDQWGRPTTSNVAPQRQQNVRRDRHSAILPPPHGSGTGFYSGEFPTEPANPFAPRYNNNPNASRVVAIEESVFALLPGEAGVNVHADGTHTGGFLASTSITHGGGGNNAQGEPANGGTAPWLTPGTQGNIPSGGNQNGVTVTHRPITVTSQPANPQNRITTVTPFTDGTIGRITIPALNNRTASVRSGVALSTLDNYVGHFPATSQWDGNIALASHNRGRGSFFAGIWTLRHGDIIFYETTMGMRVFEVVSVVQIAETDLSNLNHSHENTLTLVTCVYGQPSLRWSVRAPVAKVKRIYAVPFISIISASLGNTG
ncbi:MAG: sortase [Defluviitaleaceae bacterium]|nr:sortase [Defluviitaleaceae bacterium]